MKIRLLAGIFLLLVVFAGAAAAEPYLLYDFTGSRVNDFCGNRDVRSLIPTPEGLRIVCTPGGSDPWIEGPPCERWPQGEFRHLILELSFISKGVTSLEIFYGREFKAGASRLVTCAAGGGRQTCRVIIPRQRSGSRLRLDPGSGGGELLLTSVRLIPVESLFCPHFDAPVVPEDDGAVKLNAGELQVVHGCRWDEFSISYGGEKLACGDSGTHFAVLEGGGAAETYPGRWPAEVRPGERKLEVCCRCRDGSGVNWLLTRTFAAGEPGTLTITTSAVPEKARRVLHFPWLTLFPGLGSFGDDKRQALLPGAEYLLRESSSSELDIRGPDSRRFALSPRKICFPLMVLTTPSGKWLSLSWNPGDGLLTVFDTPDRRFRSGASLFAFWSPGIGECRQENDFNVYAAESWEGGECRTRVQTLRAGSGTSVMPALRAELAAKPLPALPDWPGGFQAAVSLLGRGWLDSGIRQGNKWRHAYRGSSFPPQQAADALVSLAWIARVSSDRELAGRAAACVAACRAGFDRGENLGSSVSHGYRDLASYLYFRCARKWLTESSGPAEKALEKVRRDGSIPCPAEKLAMTHWADHANGYTADVLAGAAEMALATGDPRFRRKFLLQTDRVLKCYRNDVPRGAQTWEVPLHTPDILGAAYMLDLCTAAYALTGKASYLEEASYWAAAGLPFVYLTGVGGRGGWDGCYSTIAVFGATGWRAPCWIGQPVQWCGLIYRNSLLFYEKFLPPGREREFWHQLASGITLAGLRECFTDSDRIGLLPDYYDLSGHRRGASAINPGTLQNGLPEVFHQGALFGRYPAGTGRVLHLLGAASGVKITGDKLEADLKLWPEYPTEVLLSGIAVAPAALLWNGQPVEFTWLEEEQTLLIPLAGAGKLELTFGRP